MENGHQPSVGLADTDRTPRSIEPQVVRQEHSSPGRRHSGLARPSFLKIAFAAAAGAKPDDFS
jgi:hypothetical protein